MSAPDVLAALIVARPAVAHVAEEAAADARQAEAEGWTAELITGAQEWERETAAHLEQVRKALEWASLQPKSPPPRKHELTLKLSADTLDELRNQLEQLAREVREEGNRSISGGYSSGHILEHVVLPDRTPEAFRAELETYIAGLSRRGVA